MPVLDLIGSALGLTSQILKFIEDSRGWNIKKDIEDLLEEINAQEKVTGHLRDDQKLDELRDALTIKVSMFSSYLAGSKIVVREAE